MVSLEKGRRDHPIDTSLSACTFSVVEKNSLEVHPKGCVTLHRIRVHTVGLSAAQAACCCCYECYSPKQIFTNKSILGFQLPTHSNTKRRTMVLLRRTWQHFPMLSSCATPMADGFGRWWCVVQKWLGGGVPTATCSHYC